ncbi:putative uncharacterized transcriptional regulatory protein [Clavispora lusitaniae]|uniref:Uncharacterized transcriptional regulatory protein n=2 Tax=Clavispora lusitaniae TaxID=36911 RepID=A0ACD0WEQ6_CLALS|nr:Fungal specific transcription factor domain family protein [Clavispora lusitaniae]QFZ25962.1 putative uncharacterized transcriptional regulatory protein [Clavispora lusitaniae]QFZ30735.1 putative uncharacterized transcriptional regulatory protein [Clavispora lusitaniae]QFZ36403.1 putative uncharacterized transcriptional regulatory protein [Clavispora lusitaniae]QFZ42087.1 putative uncharacterized transcriptional regulatory protein [Clavispora lusitaniae]
MINEEVGAPSASSKRGKTAPKKEMPLSCQRCRLRKVKCNFAHPCSSCVKLGVECIQVPNDMRKKRPPANYISSMEKKIDALSKFFTSMQRVPAEDRNKFFEANATNIASYLNEDNTQAKASSADGKVPSSGKKRKTEDVRSTPSPTPITKIRPVYGPTSVYDNYTDHHRPKTQSLRKESREMTVLQNLSKDPDVLHCLKLFFTWQYPDHNMFVFREAFFIDFFNPKPNSLYCSSVLVYSICALGSRMSDVDTIYFRSISYYNEARSFLLSNLEHPSITSVQSFLLLAFYDICNGNNSTGWMLSGDAMRMGFDLGFQLNPEVWFLKRHGTDFKPLDMAIRSRIYWGCYMADHFISLILGRPSLLKSSDASIPETSDLPELEWIDDYKYIPENVTNISDPLKNIINLISISDKMLNDIFTRSDHESVSHKESEQNEDLNLVSRLNKLFSYNEQIMQWKANLPQDLNWDQESLKNTSDNPTISVVRYYYYIVILCLNRPFVGIVRDFKDKEHLSPSVFCHNAIEDLYVAIQRFESAHGLRRASIFIVYCSILSISVILLTATTEQLQDDKKTKLKYFLRVLAGCSKTWALAEKSYKMIEIKLHLQFDNDPDFKPIISNSRKTKAKRSVSVMASTPEITGAVKKEESESPIVSETTKEDASNVESHEDNSSFPGVNNLIDNGNEANLEDGKSSFHTLENYTDFIDGSVEFFGGPPVLMTSDLFNEDWEALFPDSIFSKMGNHSH